MWTKENRARDKRDQVRYPRDVTEEEWGQLAARIPPARRGGCQRAVNIREVLNGLVYVVSTGCQWRAIPTDLAPRRTIFDYLERWKAEGTLGQSHATRYVRWSGARRTGAESECVYYRPPERKKRGKRGAALDPAGCDASKRGKGKKRHVVGDTLGLLVHALVHPANGQDRDGGMLLLASLADRFPWLRKLFADGASQGPGFGKALAKVRPQLQLEIIKRSDSVPGFVVVPKRWIVERTLAWLNRCRRLAKDFAHRIRTATAFVQLASIRLMLQKLCNPS